MLSQLFQRCRNLNLLSAIKVSKLGIFSSNNADCSFLSLTKPIRLFCDYLLQLHSVVSIQLTFLTFSSNNLNAQHVFTLSCSLPDRLKTSQPDSNSSFTMVLAAKYCAFSFKIYFLLNYCENSVRVFACKHCDRNRHPIILLQQ